jgi:hypothetical protein
LVGRKRGEGLAGLIEHALIESIAALGPVQQNRGDATGRHLDRDGLERHVRFLKA